MENNVRKILMDRPLVIPRIIINNYKKLNITEEELIIFTSSILIPLLI